MEFHPIDMADGWLLLVILLLNVTGAKISGIGAGRFNNCCCGCCIIIAEVNEVCSKLGPNSLGKLPIKGKGLRFYKRKQCKPRFFITRTTHTESK
uniref:Secreted protein n=1 Tax=Romanomermis culicivorax TaxID=13658 RepID=A0A915KQ11_ROMCU